MHNTASKAMVWVAVLIISYMAITVFGYIFGLMIAGGCLWWALNQ